MRAESMPGALRERLGIEASRALAEFIDRSHEERRAEMIAAVTERFERRMVEEVGTVRVQLAQVEASLRQDTTTMQAGLRQDMSAMEAGLRQDMAAIGAGIRQDMAAMDAGLRQEMGRIEIGIRQDIADGRFELLKWSFLFWIGQVVAVIGIVGVAVRMFRP